MTPEHESLRRYLRDVPACRIATVRADSGPHVASRWFVWMPDCVWVATRVGDTTWENVTHDPRVCVVVDRGTAWAEMAGARIEGVVEAFPAEHPDLREPMSAWHEKYRIHFSGDGFERFAEQVPKLGFLRLVPGRIEAWNHRL